MHQLSKFATRIGLFRYGPIKYTVDLSLWVLAAPLAFILRLEANYLSYSRIILIYTLITIAIKASAIYIARLHRQSWHKVGIRDLFTLLRVVGWTSIFSLAAAFILNPFIAVPRSVPLLEGILAVLMLSAIRLTMRLLNEYVRRSNQPISDAEQRVLIVGAGEAGTMLVREMLRHPEAGLAPVGYLDDEEGKQNDTFVGYPVLGTIPDLPTVARYTGIDEVLIAMPSAPGEVIRQVVALAREANVKYRIIPGVYDILSGRVSINQIREVDVEDLLRRDVVNLDTHKIAEYLQGQIVLITGAGGSIGSEIVRQAIQFNPSQIIMLDRDENNLYLFELELHKTYPWLHYKSLVTDIQRYDKLYHILDSYRPSVIFHAAAHKHVPVMEDNPDEAVLNNVLGTKNMLMAAQAVGVKRFVNISTDKAVHPTSVMGATKRIAEYLVEISAGQASVDQAYVSVRFGNVLGSRGSVVPIFKEQIRLGGPVTVTHPQMTRYFMSIPEATQLVLQAAGQADNKALYILDMGEPVKIVDLAHDLIELSGFRPGVDIQIEFVGLRPGEKLYEELLTEEEDLVATHHEKIFTVPPRETTHSDDRIEEIDRLIAAAHAYEQEQVRAILKELIPNYKSSALD